MELEQRYRLGEQNSHGGHACFAPEGFVFFLLRGGRAFVRGARAGFDNYNQRRLWSAAGLFILWTKILETQAGFLEAPLFTIKK
jgi:hypothetical protein